MYRQTDETKTKAKLYAQTETGKASKARASKKYLQTETGKANNAEAQQKWREKKKFEKLQKIDIKI